MKTEAVRYSYRKCCTENENTAREIEGIGEKNQGSRFLVLESWKVLESKQEKG